MKQPGLVARFLQQLLILARPLQHAILGVASCLYPVSCTDYALQQLEETDLHTALWLIIKRVVSCNPLTSFWHHTKNNRNYFEI